MSFLEDMAARYLASLTPEQIRAGLPAWLAGLSPEQFEAALAAAVAEYHARRAKTKLLQEVRP